MSSRVGPARSFVVALGGALIVSACAQGPRSPLVPTGVITRVDTNYYDVPGTTPLEWARNIHRAASAAGLDYPAVGSTWSGPSWSFASVRSTAMGCEASHPQVTLSIRFLMPRLRDDSLVTGEARAEWQRFDAALWTHEQGHALRAARAAEKLRVEMHRPRGPTCREFVAEVRATSDSLFAALRGAQVAYDSVSRHGQRQGTTIVVDRRRSWAIDTTYHDTIP